MTQEIAADQNAVAMLARAELDQQVSTAKAYPRNIAKFKASALEMATLDQDTAAGCFYVLKRGSGDDAKPIEGPSIRLAEIVGSAWGNLNYGARVVSIDEKFLTAQGICRDLERNVTMTAEVTRRIWGKRGRYSDDMIGVTANAACSIALRNAIFKVVPMAYVKDVLAQARRVAVGDAKTLELRRTQMIEYFGKMGVPLNRVLWLLNKTGIADITLDDMQVLVGLATAIKDGDTTVDEAFPTSDPNAAPVQPPVAPASKAEAMAAKPTQAPQPQAAPVHADVLTVKEQVFCGRLPGKGDKLGAAKHKMVADMDDNELQTAQDEAEMAKADPASASRALGVLNLIAAERERRAKAGK